ncbi:TPA: hypothetical protein ACGBG5_001722 [Enterococcus faecalis]
MELDRLEVVFDGDLSPIEEKVAQFEQKMDSMMSRVKSSSGQGMDAVEKNLSDSKGFDKFTKQFEKMNSNFDSMLKRMNQSASSNGEEVGKSLSAGVSKGAAKMTKDIQTAVDKVNTQMQQAKAAQQRIANLQADKNGARLSGDTKSESRIGEQISKAQIQMNKSQQQAQAIVRGLRSEYDAIPNSLSTISAKMESNERQIESMRAKLKALKNDMRMQQTETGSFASGKWKATGIKETPKSLKTAETITKQSAKMEKLIADNDALQRSYAKLEDRSSALKTALSSVNTKLGEQPSKIRMATNGMRNLLGATKRSEGLFSRFKGKMANSIGRFGDLFQKQTRKVKNGTNRMSQGMNGFGRSMRRLWSTIIIFGILYKGVMALAGGLFRALQTNAQFSASLNQIKVNLLTAFYPIYQAALPAINALMSALAKVTGYIAGFISTLFGMKIGDAFNGAQGLMNNVQALEDTGSAAADASDGYDEMVQSIKESNKQLKAQHDRTEAARKKAQEYKKLLAGFDELNVLDFSDKDFEKEAFEPQKIPGRPKNPGGSGSAPWADFGSAMVPETPKWLTNFSDKFKDIMSKLFDPIKKAWDAQGQKVIDAWKHALSEVGGLIQAIGKSFMDVWTNGTGQKFVENLLIALTDVLNTIGDIAGAFKRAWEDNGRGTALIQSIFDMFNAILELLHQIAVSFRNAWNDGLGEKIAGHILEIFTDINNIIKNLADRLSEAWQKGAVGESIFKTILGIIEGVLGHLANVTKATEEWARTLDFTPLLNSVKKLLESLQPLTDNLGAGLDWFFKNVLLPLASYAIEDLIPAFLNALAGAIDLVNGIIEGSKPAFKFLWDNMLKPIAKWTGGVAVDVLKGLGDALSGIGDFISKHGEGFSNFVLALGSFATVLGVISQLSGLIVILKEVWSWLSLITSLGDLLSLLGMALGDLVAVLGGPITLAIAAAVAAGVLLWKNWDWIKEKAGEIGAWIGEKWDGIKSATSEAWNNVKKWTSEKWNAAKDAVTSKASEIYNSAKEKFNNVANTVKEKAGNAKDWATEKWEGLKSSTSSKFEKLRNAASSKMSNVAEAVRLGAESAKSKAVSAFGNLKEGVSSKLNDVKSVASDVFGKIGSWASELPGKIASGLSNGIQAIGNVIGNIATTIARPIGGAVNSAIGAINWVLGAVNASWKLNEWPIPAYQRGTNYHPGGPALVNDAPGSRFQEMFKLRDGRIGMFPKKRNLLVDLPKGAQVLPGNMVPHYSGGIFSTFKDFFVNGFDKAKGIAEDVWNVISNPSELISEAISRFVNISWMQDPMWSIASGFLNYAKDAVSNMIVDMINNFTGFSEGGIVDRFGLYQLAEGDNPEMVVPLSKPQLAFQRINEALDFMGYEELPDLTMPEVFRDSSDGYSGSSISKKGTSTMAVSGNGLEGLSANLLATLGESIANAIVTALSNLNLGKGDQPMEIILEVDSTRLGQVTIKGINQYHEQLGYNTLNI